MRVRRFFIVSGFMVVTGLLPVGSGIALGSQGAGDGDVGPVEAGGLEVVEAGGLEVVEAPGDEGGSLGQGEPDSAPVEAGEGEGEGEGESQGVEEQGAPGAEEPEAGDCSGGEVPVPQALARGTGPVVKFAPGEGPTFRVARPPVSPGELRLGLTGTDYSLLQLEVTGFDKLPLEQKMFAWHLYRAVVLGNEILFHQNHPSGSILRQLLLTLWEHRSAMVEEVETALGEYLTCFFLNHGQYGHRSGAKFVPGYLTWPMVVHAIEVARARGEALRFLPGLDDQARLRWVFVNMFHPWEDPRLIGAGGRVAGTVTNIYGPGVSGESIRLLPEEDQACVNCVYRSLGEGGVEVARYGESGLLGPCFGSLIGELEAAVQYAGGQAQKDGLEHLIAHLRTGDGEGFKEFFRQWVKGGDQVDYMMGFVEPLKDPRGVVGTWQGVVWIPAHYGVGHSMAQAAPALEQRMPWPDRYKRTDGFDTGVQFAQALVGTGDMGPIPWAGFNLPNYEDIQGEQGTRRIIFTNMADVWSEGEWEALVEEFWLPRYTVGAKAYGKGIRLARMLLRGLFGYGSGQPDPTLDGVPADHLGRVYAPLEEARADLVALHLMGAPELVEWGLVEENDSVRFSNYALLDYLQRAFVEQGFYGDTQVRGAHQVASQMILRYLVLGGRDGRSDFGLKVVQSGSKGLALQVDDFDKLREGVARLLGLLQVYKSTGNSRAAEVLFDDLAGSYLPQWQAEVAARVDRVGVARVRGFVFPKLELVSGRGGEPVDVVLVGGQSFLEQQLEFGAQSGCCSCQTPGE